MTSTEALPTTASDSLLEQKIRTSWMASNATFQYPFVEDDSSDETKQNDDKKNDGGKDMIRTQNLRKRWDDSILFALKQSDYHDVAERLSSSLSPPSSTVDSNTNNIEGTTHHPPIEDLIQTVNSWFQKLVVAHSEVERSYHTLCHLEEMFAFLDLIMHHNDSEEKTASDDEFMVILTLSVFFHDAIYNPKSGTNEEDSAKLYQEFEQSLFHALPKDKGQREWRGSQRVVDYILATKSHSFDDDDPNSTEERDQQSEMNKYYLKLFLDVDMAVLGKEPLAYDHYAGLIREEYKHVPHDVYCEKRAEVLQSFIGETQPIEHEEGDCSLDKSKRSIFASDLMKNALEERAINNLRREIASLQKGKLL